MAAEKLLSEAACKSAKAKSAIYYLNDGAGLRMRITALHIKLDLPGIKGVQLPKELIFSK